jgi:hypothetical protein
MLVLMGSAVLESVEVAARTFHSGATGPILLSAGTALARRRRRRRVWSRGRTFIDHVDVPEQVLLAYRNVTGQTSSAQPVDEAGTIRRRTL